MEQREKLIELLNQYRECLYDEEINCNDCDYKDVGECFNTRLADYLLANGVVVLPCRCCECERYSGDSEAKPIRHAHWTDDHKCSACGGEVFFRNGKHSS